MAAPELSYNADLNEKRTSESIKDVESTRSPDSDGYTEEFVQKTLSVNVQGTYLTSPHFIPKQASSRLEDIASPHLCLCTGPDGSVRA